MQALHLTLGKSWSWESPATASSQCLGAPCGRESVSPDGGRRAQEEAWIPRALSTSWGLSTGHAGQQSNYRLSFSVRKMRLHVSALLLEKSVFLKSLSSLRFSHQWQQGGVCAGPSLQPFIRAQETLTLTAVLCTCIFPLSSIVKQGFLSPFQRPEHCHGK